MKTFSFRSVGIVVFLSIAFSFGGTEVSTVQSCLDHFNRYFNDIASEQSFAGQDLDSVNSIFKKIEKKYPMVTVLLRTNSTGDVINSVASDGGKSAQSVAGQKWFSFVKDSAKTYYGVARDPSGATCLFWAWPLQAGKGKQSRFAGALTAKIDAAKLFADRIDSTGSPLQIIIKGKPVFSRNWKKDASFKEDTIGSFGQSAPSVRYGDGSNANGSGQQTDTISTASVTDSADSAIATAADTDTTNEAQAVSAASANASDTAAAMQDSTAQAAMTSPLIKIIQVSVALIIAAILLTAILLYMRKKKHADPYATIENKREQASRGTRPGETSRLYARVPSLNEKKPQQHTVQSSSNGKSSNAEEDFIVDAPDDGIVKGSVKPIRKKYEAASQNGKSGSAPAPARATAAPLIEQDPAQPSTPEPQEIEIVRPAPSLQNEKAPAVPSKVNGSLKSKSYEAMENEIRAKLYREIHGQITHWVISELDQIKGKLKILTEQLHRLEQDNHISSEYEEETRDLASDIERFEQELMKKKEE